MRVLFCKISSMKYYKGHCPEDTPINGGQYVNEHGYGHEEFNFRPFLLDDNDQLECLGFVEPKSNRGCRNTFHLERIDGCSLMKSEPCVEDVLVVWCATRLQRDTTVVGWYKHATVWRKLQNWIVSWEDAPKEDRCYNVRADASNCVLLPEGERNRNIWAVPSAKYTKAYGFGQSMVWYPTETKAEPYLKQLVVNINHYSNENWIDRYPVH